MATFKIRCSEWVFANREDSDGKYQPTTHVIIAERMEVFRSGALGIMQGHDKAGRDTLVRVFAPGEWQQAWSEDEARQESGAAG